METADDFLWELVIVDNNSNDETNDVVSQFRATTTINVNYVVEKRQGLSFARNCGIQVKKGKITVFTDDDVVVDKFWLSNMVQAFKRYGAGCVGGKILPLWEYPPPKWLGSELYSYLALLDLGEDVLRLKTPNIWGANFAVASVLFEKYGGFDTKLGRQPNKLYGLEETALLDKLIRGGEKVYYCPEVVVHHCIPATRMKKAYFRKWKFDEGENRAIRSQDAEVKKPFRMLFKHIEHLIRTMVHFCRIVSFKPEEAFVDELKAISDLGYIRQTFRQLIFR
jgi:glycosyltransferase involved in cell wall biosynthesis